jgi:hypothetical protein
MSVAILPQGQVPRLSFLRLVRRDSFYTEEFCRSRSVVVMSLAGSSTDGSPSKKVRVRVKSMSLDLAKDGTYQSMVEAVAQSVKDSSGEASGPMDTLSKLKEERAAAKKTSLEKTKEVKAYAKRVARLQHRAAKLSDDGLLVEYARRQAAKARKEQIEARGFSPQA